MSYFRVIPKKRMNLSSAAQHPTTAPTRRLSRPGPGRKKKDPAESLENALDIAPYIVISSVFDILFTAINNRMYVFSRNFCKYALYFIIIGILFSLEDAVQ